MSPRSLHDGSSDSATRQRRSSGLLVFGWLAVTAGLLTAFGGIGLIILAFVPLPFSAAAVLRPTWPRIGSALFVWGCWFFSLWHVLI